MAPANGDWLAVADVGCSTGDQTWGFAAALAAQEVDFRIDAFDNNVERLAQATQPLQMSMGSLAASRYRHPAYPEACLAEFEDGGCYVRPSRRLRERVDFQYRNIVTDPLPPKPYDVVVVTNVLYHYLTYPQKLEAIIGNIAAGLRPGAVVIHDGYLSEGIDERLRDRHLYPSAIAGIACANSVFVYEPQRPTEGLRGSLLDLRDKTLLAASKSHLFNRDR